MTASSLSPRQPLAVTTSVNPPGDLESQAREVAQELNAAYIPRQGRSLALIFAEGDTDRLLIAGGDHLRLRDRATGTEYFYHPNLFQIRAANVLRGEPDHFLEAAALSPGDRLLDCTLGFASEAALAALTVGEAGAVVGLESVPELALVTGRGLRTFPMHTAEMASALRRIHVISANSREYLFGCTEGMFDVVYFDPFFDHRLSGSEASVSPLFLFGNPAPLDPDVVLQACRVAQRRVVIKHPRDAALPKSVADRVTTTVGSRKSRVVYSVISDCLGYNEG